MSIRTGCVAVAVVLGLIVFGCGVSDDEKGSSQAAPETSESPTVEDAPYSSPSVEREDDGEEGGNGRIGPNQTEKEKEFDENIRANFYDPDSEDEEQVREETPTSTGGLRPTPESTSMKRESLSV
ncbi:hypothetical protein HDA32_001142 [Spinactinospora alkalitolerans]|uniref:Uncharacterized protein n=1 Tax=Spinactinospora alkalitolerans TaxID=687207 RepID=A0A852TT40_9ACTN|nr:hypothetical protein [Spinactinospora alkalitolerans]NYE46022.1 hypothetical protein [Spinactinospora alkalitolerans]